MNETDSKSSLEIFWRYTAGASAVWTILVLLSFAWNSSVNQRQGEQLIHKEANANFDTNQAFRQWGNDHGGVYVPVTPDTPPSPYMEHIPDRDITTPSGKKLTLLNPAYMARQLTENYETANGIKGKLTALTLLNEDNAPDAWEKEALLRLKAGMKEVVEHSDIDGAPYLRLMRPIYMEPGCEKCHGHLGFKAGEFRGGVSLSVPATPYIAARKDAFASLVISHVLAWVLGMVGMFLASRKIQLQILEVHNTENQLRQSEYIMSEILRISPSAILTTLADGTITHFNEGATEIFGFSAEEIIGQSINLLIPDSARHAHAGYFADFEAAGKRTLRMGSRSPVAGLRRDGTHFPAAASVSRLKIGEHVYFTVALHDLTDQVVREQELLDARDLADVANRSKSEFLANMSHEIRTPLTAVTGMLDLVDTTQLTEDDKRHIRVAQTASDSVVTIINDILDLARLEAGRIELESTVFDLREFALQTWHIMLDTARRKNLDLKLEFPGDNPLWIKSDQQHLRQILINLINNAIKFTDQGTVTLAIGALEHHDGTLDLTFQVKDTGVGIPEKDLPRLFRRFEQQDSTSSRKHNGVGLGLSICKELAELMNGSMTATSIEGKGSTFQLQLTCEAARQEPGMTTTSTNDLIPLSPLHILVAEDNMINQLLVSEFLDRLGHTYELTANGEEAIAAYTSSPNDTHFDLILMDGQMPIMDGLEATRCIRDQSLRPNDVPIVALTADAMTQHRKRYQETGFSGFIGKPYTLQELEDELKRVVNEHRRQSGKSLQKDSQSAAS